MSKYLAVPKSQSSLKFDGEKAINEANPGESFDIRDGVVIFDPSALENSDTRGNLGALLEKARRVGCVQAIEELSNARDYLLDSDRRKYIDLIDLQPSSVVLEIGASMGQHTRFIAEKCQHLEALEIVYEQAAFARQWCEESGLSNVNVSAGGSDGYLPYKDNSFDALIMNYVLEWSAGRSGSHPAGYHHQLLSECLRVIKPGGVIFLSTKNRFNIGLLLGGTDEHFGFRFGSALPRWLGSFLSKFIKSSELLGYLHSRSAIEGIFSKVGFTDLKPILMLPDARRANVVESFNPEGLARINQQAYWKTASRKERLFSKLPFFLQKNVAPSHVYLASKPRAS